MNFSTLIRRIFMDFFKFLAIAIWFFFLYYKLWPFVNAAIKLHQINFQSISYMGYTLFLLFLPIALLWSPPFNKLTLLRFICNVTAFFLLLGTIADFFVFHPFLSYTFKEGDMIFCNIISGIPGYLGSISCILMAVAYFFFGMEIAHNRAIAYLLFILILALNVAPAFLYSYYLTGFMPRDTWIEKAAFIVPQQLFIVISLSFSVGSKDLWMKNIW